MSASPCQQVSCTATPQAKNRGRHAASQGWRLATQTPATRSAALTVCRPLAWIFTISLASRLKHAMRALKKRRLSSRIGCYFQWREPRGLDASNFATHTHTLTHTLQANSISQTRSAAEKNVRAIKQRHIQHAKSVSNARTVMAACNASLCHQTSTSPRPPDPLALAALCVTSLVSVCCSQIFTDGECQTGEDFDLYNVKDICCPSSERTHGRITGASCCAVLGPASAGVPVGQTCCTSFTDVWNITNVRQD